MREHLENVLLRFRVRRNFAVAFDNRLLAGIVGSDTQLNVMIEAAQQVPQVLSATADVLRRVVGIHDAIVARGQGHELHQPDGPFARHRTRIVSRLDDDNRVQQVGIEPVEVRRLLDDLVKAFLARWRRIGRGTAGLLDQWLVARIEKDRGEDLRRVLAPVRIEFRMQQGGAGQRANECNSQGCVPVHSPLLCHAPSLIHRGSG